MKPSRFWLLAVLLLGISPAQAQLAPVAPAPTTRVTSTVTKQDALGFKWDVDYRTGSIKYGNSVFSNAQAMTVNGSNFYVSQAQGSADGQIYLNKALNAINVSRRVKIDTKNSVARFVDSFTNTGSSDAIVAVVLTTRLRSSAKAIMTSSGQTLSSASGSATVGLGEKDVGMVAVTTSTSRPDVLWFVSGPRASVQPVVAASSNYQLTFTFNLTIPAGKQVTLLHGLAQRNLAAHDATTLAAAFKPFTDRQFSKDLSREERATVINGRRYSGLAIPSGPLLQGVMDLEDRFGVERENADLLLVDEDSHLTGTLQGEAVQVHGHLGKTTVQVDDIAGLIGGAGRGRSHRVYLRNGEILNGTIDAGKLKFAAEGGIQVDVDPDLLNALLTKAGKEDGEPGDQADLLVETFVGDRFAVQGGLSTTLKAATPWGVIDLPLRLVRRLVVVRDPQPMQRVLLKDRSQLSVILTGEPVPFDSMRFGTVTLAPVSIARLRTIADVKQGEEETKDDEELKSPHWRLAGNNLLVGRVTTTELQLATGAGTAPVEIAQVISLQRQEKNQFEVTMSDGSTTSGRLTNPLVVIEAAGQTWKIPPRHVLAFRQSLSRVAVAPDDSTPVETAPAELNAEERAKLLSELIEQFRNATDANQKSELLKQIQELQRSR